MSRKVKDLITVTCVVAVCFAAGDSAFGNGGPFVLKYPNGDPAAKGVLARLDPDLRPAREERLRVIKEELKVTFRISRISLRSPVAEALPRGAAPATAPDAPPLVYVSAEYTIENPTAEDIGVDFGFPILRGVYIDPRSMILRPDVRVRLGDHDIPCTIISNSAIYGIIRQRARETIENGIAADVELGKLIEAVRSADSDARARARGQLASYLTGRMNWSQRDAALMVEYASLDFGNAKSFPRDRDRWAFGSRDLKLLEMPDKNLGAVAAIGEQKATQFFAQLASRFDTDATAAYERIFAAWGGDVRERSVDLETGKVRPREIEVDDKVLGENAAWNTDPTIYARVDYLDPRANITEQEKESCRAILKNLPVVFTFAPMNIIHYRVTFPAGSTEKLTVSYSQHAYKDTRDPSSYQLAYVVHPASLWNEFGPINLEVAAPEGVGFRASVACANGAAEDKKLYMFHDKTTPCSIYRTIVKDKQGELFLAVDRADWEKFNMQFAADVQPKTRQVAAQPQQKAGL